MFIIIELHSGAEQATIMQEDGENAVFNSWEEANDYATENCQDGQVTELFA